MLIKYYQYVIGAIACAAVWWVTSTYYERRILEERSQAENAVIDQCNTRIAGYESRIKTIQKDFVAIGKRSDAMSNRVLADCKPLGLPGARDTSTRYGLYGSDGLFLIQFAKRCAENLAATKPE